MSYLSVVVVAHDAIDAISEDRDFGKNLHKAILRRQRGGNMFVPARGKHSALSCAAWVIGIMKFREPSIAVFGGIYGDTMLGPDEQQVMFEALAKFRKKKVKEKVQIFLLVRPSNLRADILFIPASDERQIDSILPMWEFI